MLISLKHKLVFLAVPKTGSTSIEASLAPYCDIIFQNNSQVKHMTLKRFHRHMAPYLWAIGQDNLEICALIREPIDWLGSWFRYRSRAELAGHANATSDMSFDTFAQSYMEDPKPGFATVGQQAIFLERPKAFEGQLKIFRYENMAGFQTFLRDRIGQPLTFDTLNPSPHADLDLSENTRRSLKDYFRADYALWEDAVTGH